jgi:hypothetical protein
MIIGIGNDDAAEEDALWAGFPSLGIFPSKACFIKLPPEAGGGLLLPVPSGFRLLLSWPASRGAFAELASAAATRGGLGGGDALPIRAMIFLSLFQNGWTESAVHPAWRAGRSLARIAFPRQQ